MTKLERWYTDFPALDEPETNFLQELRAYNEQLRARRAVIFGRIAEYGTEEDEREALVELDHAACDRWLVDAARDFDVTTEVPF